MPRSFLRSILGACALFVFAGCGGNNGTFTQGDVTYADGTMAEAVPFPPTDVVTAPDVHDAAPAFPLLLAVEPDHGPFNGGNTVTLRGSNLNANLSVTFGTSLVQPVTEMLTDSHRLVVTVPAGQPGTVDVAIDDGVHHSRVAQAYTYDDFYVDPASGSVAGGTFVTLHGQNTNWTASSTVTIDSSPCGSVTFVSPNELTCVVPAHLQGNVPVTVTTGTVADTVADAFQYYNGADQVSGGFGGGHITGSINVTVLNYMNGAPLPMAYVYLGTNPTVAPPMAGITNAMGQVTLSAPDLTGPVTVTATAHCFASSTFISVDGRDGTIYLLPWLGQVAGVDCGHPPPPPAGNGEIYAASISGELVWAGPNEFGPNPWRNIPMPLANEHRVAYVYTTTDSIFGANPDPGMGNRVLEMIPPNYGGRGYAYTIVARPAALAVYALAGLETNDTPPRFTPYIMGVARGVLTSPRAMLTNVDLDMNIPLDHETTVNLHDLPPQDGSGEPDQFKVQVWTDLGGEGVIPRPEVTAFGVDPTQPYILPAQPAFDGALADARLTVRARYGTNMDIEDPESTVVVAGIETPDLTVDVGNWVGIPQVTSPMNGGVIPSTREIQIGVSGNNPDFFWSVISQSGSTCRYGFYIGDVVWWQHYMPGTIRALDVPDISSIPGLTDIPQGLYVFSLCGIHVQDFDFNNFRYQYLSEYYWTAFSSNTFTIAR